MMVRLYHGRVPCPSCGSEAAPCWWKIAAAMRGPPPRDAKERAWSWVNWALRSAVGTESAKSASVFESQAVVRPQKIPAAQKRWYLP